MALGYKPITSTPIKEAPVKPEAALPLSSLGQGLGYKPIEEPKSLGEQTVEVGKGIFQTGKNIVQTLTTPEGLKDVGETFVEGGIPSLKNVLYNYSDMFYGGFSKAWKTLGVDIFADYAAKDQQDARARAKVASDEVKSFMTARQGGDTRPFLERLSAPDGEKEVASIIGTQLPTFLAIIGSGVLSRGASLPQAPAILATSFAMNSGDAYQQGKDYLERTGQEMTPENEAKLSKSALMVGVTTAPLDLFGVERILGSIGTQKVKQTFFKHAMKAVVDTGANVLAEGGTEGLQEVIQNAWARTFDEEQSLWDGALEAAFGGGLFGGGATITIHSAGLLRSGIMGRLKAGDTPEEVTAKIEETAKSSGTPIDKEQIAEVVNEVAGGYQGIIDTEVKAPLQAGATPTEVALKLADKLGTDQAKTIADRVATELATQKPPEPTATEKSAEAFLDIEKKVDESVLERKPSDLQQSFNAFQEKLDADVKGIRDSIAELEKKVQEAAPRSQEKKDAKIALEADRKRLREAEAVAEEKLVGHATELRTFLAENIKGQGVDLSETEMDNVLDEVLSRALEGNYGAPYYEQPLSEIVAGVLRENKAAEPSAPSPTEQAPSLSDEQKQRVHDLLGHASADENAKPAPAMNAEAERRFTEKYVGKKDTGKMTMGEIFDAMARIVKDVEEGRPEEKTQKQKVKEVVAKKGAASIKEIAKETKILEPNIRRILGVGAKDGTFERVADGVYRLNIGDQEVAVVIPGDAKDVLPQLVKDGFKADMVFLDIPYDTKAVKGGNRGVKYDLLSVKDFSGVLDNVKDILRTKDSALLYMYSQAKSGLADMARYNTLLTEKGFTAVARGEYKKLSPNGKPVTFPTRAGSKELEAEGLLVLNQSGSIDFLGAEADKIIKGEKNPLNFRMVRPKGYQTEKPAEMLKALIEMTTKEGEVVFDPFAGSGVTGSEAVRAKRRAVLIEKNPEAVREHIVPKLKKAIDETAKVRNDKDNGDDTDSRGKDNGGGVPETPPDRGNKPGGAGEATARTRGGRQAGGLGERGGDTGKRPSARLTNEEVEKIVATVAEISKDSHREVKLVGEITDEVLEAANQYKAGGIAKEGRGVLDEYYTSSEIVDLVKSLFDFPATKLKVLEPSAGTGNFLYALPETAEHTIAALEINETTAKIAKIFHPTARVFATPFESIFMDERGNKREYAQDFDLVIGNPPYGEHRGRYLGLGEMKSITRYEDYFIKRGLDVLKPGGKLVMVVPSSFVRSGENNTKIGIITRGELVTAFRLPNGVFAGTDVGTDVLVFEKTKGFGWAGSISPIVNDGFFIENPSNILGKTVKRKNRFGKMEDYVEGTLEDAIQRFYAENDRPQAIALLKELKQEATPENIEAAEASIEEGGDKAKELIEDEATAKGKRTIEKKIVRKADKKGEATAALQSQFKAEHSETELAIWKKTSPEGFVINPTEAEKKTLNFVAGKYYNDFNYQQGDIYEKEEQLEQDKSVLGKERYEAQKKKLEAVLPKQEKIDEIKLSPNVGFVKDLDLETGLIERDEEVELRPGEKEAVVTGSDGVDNANKGSATSLQQRFLKWLRTLPREALGDSSEYEVREYVLDVQVRGSDKDRNERIRVRRKIMADNLFGKFLREELSTDEKNKVEDAYNRTFNFYHTPDYTKVPMFAEVYTTFKGRPFRLKEAQRAGVGRLVNTGVGILAHEVGFGKTISGALSAHEIMARGWAKRPIFIVPSDSHAEQWADTIRELVPGAQVNMLGNLGVTFKGDLSSLTIPEGSFSILTYEGFKRLSFSDTTYGSLSSQFRYIADDLETHRKTAREQEKGRAEAEGIAGKMKKGTRADLFFEKLGFDYMTFDEAHNANHIVSKVKLKKGQSSEFGRFALRPSDLGVKTWLAAQYIQQEQKGRNVALLSATPFTNHPLEYYSVLSLVADKSLTKMGFRNVNDFFGTFMEAEHEYEFKADGTYQKKTDIRRFRNFRQFRKLLDTYIDFRQEASDLQRPNRVQINYEIPKNPMTRDLEAQAQAIFKENEQEKGKGAKVLRAITELRKVSFSPYASKFSPDIAPEHYREFVENSPKLAAVMGIVAQNLKDRPDAGQIIYSEVGVEFFPLLREYLVKVLGIKAEEVDIIRGGTSASARLAIQTRFNEGKVKILLGSEAISEGLNLQENTSDMHLLSLPWNFTALRQVVGRAWRQGNRFGNVRINQYFIQDSVDVFLSQKLDNKQRRYENALATSANEIDVGDVSYNEMKFDLIQDPETRAKLEVEAKKEQMKADISQEKAELAFATRKLEKINDLVEQIQRAEEGLARENVKETPNEYWVKEYTNMLRSGKKLLTEETTKLKEKGIDVDTLLTRKTEGEKKVAAMEAEVARIEDTLPERIKEIAASLPPRQDFSKAVVDQFVAERAEQNKTFYTVAEAPTENTVRVAEEVKEIKNAAGTKVVKTKKTAKLVKEPVKRPAREGVTRDDRVLKILASEQPVEQKVDSILDVKQEGKKFKDVGERVGGSRKESAAIRTVIGEGDSKILAEIIRRLGWEAVSGVLNKQEILSDVAKPDPIKDVSEGVAPYVAYVKKTFYDKITRSMTLKNNRSRWSSSRFVYWKEKGNDTYTHYVSNPQREDELTAATHAIEAYPGLLRELVEKLTAVKSIADMDAFESWVRERYPAEFTYGDLIVGLDKNVFGSAISEVKFDTLRVYNDTDKEPSFYPTKRSLLSALSEIDNGLKHPNKPVSERYTQFINDKAWIDKATKKPGEGVDTELVHGNFKPLENIERSEPAVPAKEITAENLQKVYGFKSVQLGNYMDDATAKEHIHYTMGAVLDMSKLLRIDFPKLMNAMGLSIAYGARGTGRANAHYEPGKTIINLTKGRGDGSFFHEFIHFLDDRTNTRGYRHSWSSKKDRWYTSDPLDQATADLMGAITGKRVRKVVEFTPQDDSYVLERPENPIMKMYAEGKTIEEAIKFAEYRTDTIERNGRKQTYQISKSQTYQEIADVYREVVKQEASVYHEETEYLKGSKQYGSDYWSRPEELLARAGQAYIEDKLAAAGMKNNYLTRTTLAASENDPTKKVYPQGEERKLFNTHFDRVFAALSARYPVEDYTTGDVPRTARFRLSDLFKEQAEVGMTEAAAYLADVKERLKLDFDVFFADALLAGHKMNPLTRRKTPIEAWGATLDNTVILAKEMTRFTAPHEVVHLTLANMEKIPIFKRNGITREAVISAKAAQMGITIKNEIDDARVDEQLAMDFEAYLNNTHEPKGIVRKFFAMLKRLVMQLARAIVGTQNDIIHDYYEILDEAVETEETMTRLESTGAIEAFIAETEGDVLDLEKMEEAVPRFKLKDEKDKRLQNYKRRFNDLLGKQGQLEEDTVAWKTDLMREIEKKSEIAPEVQATPPNVKEAARFTNRKAPPIGQLTERGAMEVSELGFASPEEAQAEIYAYLKRKAELISTRNRLRDLRRKIASARKEGKEGRAALRDIERRLRQRKRYLEQKDYYVGLGLERGKKEQMRMIRRRGRVIREIQDQFAIGDSRAKAIVGGRRIHLMTEQQFDDFVVEFFNRAEELGNTLSAQEEVKGILIEKQLQKFENLQRAMQLPPLAKMKEAEARRFADVLSTYQFGDVFLPTRQLELIHRTNWGDLKTEREVLEKMQSVMGFGREEMKGLTSPEGLLAADGVRGVDTSWIRLARQHPFFNWLVGKRVEAKIQEERETLAIEYDLNRFFRAARRSRRSQMGVKGRILEMAIPTDDVIFDYLEAKDKEAFAKEKNMTEEEAKAAQYLILQFFNAYEYLKSEYGMKGRENYMTHARRSFFEAMKDDGAMAAIREVLTSQKEDAAAFKIVDETGEVLAFEKFFGNALRRSGALVPSKNVARVSLGYFRALARKRALDKFIPEAMIAVQAHKALVGETPRGLSKDPTLEKYVKAFLNDAKGRKISFGTAQGSKADVALRAFVSWTAIKYLGYNVASAIGNLFGDFAAIFWELKTSEVIRGVYRSVAHPKTAHEINEQFRYFTGRNPIVELFDTQYGLPERLKKSFMALMGIASFQSNKFFLRAKLTDEEFRTMVVEDARLAEIAQSLSRVKPNTFYIRSLAGNTTVGGSAFQFGTWAVAITNTVLSDGQEVVKTFNKKDFKTALTSREAAQLLKFGILAGVLYAVVAALLTPDDEDKTDNSLYARTLRSIRNNLNTLIQALQFTTDPSNYFLIVKEIIIWTTAFQQILSQERYKSDGKGFAIGDLKWIRTGERAVTPSALRQLFPEQKESALENSVSEAIQSGKPIDAAAVAKAISPDWAEMEEESQKRKVESVQRLYNIRKSHPNDPVVELILEGDNNKERVEKLLEYGKEVGEGNVYTKVKQLYRDPNVCADPRKRTGCLISGQLLKEYQKARKK